MSYVDQAFSISDEDVMMEGAYVVHQRPPVKEIALSVGLLVSGVLGIVSGVLMAANRVGGDPTHGVFFALLGSVLVIPRVYKGYKGFSFANIPAA
ncbi:uncharacterized protein LOC141827161 [Curcuma longa]|uniref:uncharacterized protein LOC141827161 n=1 Tax=Curcuma longa TaxID=136217 RepID=UPI003D9F4E3D